MNFYNITGFFSKNNFHNLSKILKIKAMQTKERAG